MKQTTKKLLAKKENLLKGNIFFLANGQYGFIYTLSILLVLSLDLVEYLQRDKIPSLAVYVEKLIRISSTQFSSAFYEYHTIFIFTNVYLIYAIHSLKRLWCKHYKVFKICLTIFQCYV